MIGRVTDFKDHFYRSADDRLDLYARVYDDCTDGIPILMMHGLTRNSADFENIAELLRPDNQLVIADQRGRGRSEYDPVSANYHPGVYAEDMFALLGSLGIEQAILLGTSMGGIIAMLMAARQPDIARALIVNDIGPEVTPAGLERLRNYVGKPVQVSDWQDAADHCRQTNKIAFPEYRSEDWKAFAKRTFIADECGVPKLAYDMAISEGVQGQAPTAAPADLWQAWDLLSQVPVLAIHGERSDILSAETLEQMKRRHSGRFLLVEIPGRGHAPMLDEPIACSTITEFLDGLRS